MAIGGFIYGDLMSANAKRPTGFGSFREGVADAEGIGDFFRRGKLRDRAHEIYADNPEAAAYGQAGMFDAALKSQEARARAAEAQNESEYRAARLGLDRERLNFDKNNPKKDPVELFLEKEQIKDRMNQDKSIGALDVSIAGLENLLSANEDIAGKFDNSIKGDESDTSGFKNTNAFKGRRNWLTNALWGVGATDDEYATRKEFDAVKERQINEIYQTLKGSGAITENELEKQAASAMKAGNPYELKIAIDSMLNHIKSKRNALSGTASGTRGASKYKVIEE